MNILIVDDNVLNRELLSAVLQAENFNFMEAADGLEALALLAGNRIDAVISDLLMPRMDGFRLCQQVRTSESFAHVPIIIYSSTYTSAADQKLALEFGADEFIRKPASAKIITDALRKVIAAAPNRTSKSGEGSEELALAKEYSARLAAKLEHKSLELAAKAEEMHQAEQQLRLQSAAIETAADGILITDRQGAIVWVNSAFTALTGYTPGDVLGQNTRLLKSGRHDQAFYARLWQTILAGDTWRGSFINRRKDGGFYDDERAITPVRAKGGAITHFVAVMRDVTQRKRAEEEHARLAAIVESANDAIIGKTLTGLVVTWNQAAERIFGYSAGEMMGKSISVLVPGAQLSEFQQMQPQIARGESIAPFETLRLRKDGRQIPVSLTVSPIKNVSGQVIGASAIVRDISERKHLEAQVIQAQRMEAVGQLAGGLAHDFNNLLMVIRGNVELSLMDAGPLTAENRDCLKRAVDASEMAANLTRQLLIFSRKQVLQTQPVALNELVQNLTKLLRRSLREDVRVECRYADKLHFVQADPGMLEQVLLNLVVNARDAMPRGGQLLITTAQVSFDTAFAKSNPDARAGQFVCLEVKDSGTGIAPEHLARIFEPFFTTKEVGKGTGLGLATVYSIVKQHQGWVEVFSQVGLGTTFKILLPAIPSSPKPEAVAQPLTRSRRGTETILLVEDDCAVRSITRRVVESSGYKVHEAACAREAVDVWNRCSAEIALLLTDIVMPGGMTGRDLVSQLRGQKPGLKAILMSGHSADSIDKNTEPVRPIETHFLQKPCSSTSLLQTLRECLDERG